MLKVLLRQQHLQTHAAFASEYEKTARRIDRSLVGSAPGREQLQRWLSGQVKTQPRPHHCRVLEQMFPGYTTAELLAPYQPASAAIAMTSMSDMTAAATFGTDPTDSVLPTPSDMSAADAPGGADGSTSPAGVRPMGGTGPGPQGTAATIRIGTTAVPAGLAGLVWAGPDRLEATLDSGSAGPGRLDFLDAEAERLALRVLKVPPAELLPEAVLHMNSVRDLLADRQPGRVQRDLSRIAAKFALILAEILWNENQLTLARRWYASARRAADEAGDRFLADLALCGAAYLPTWGGDPRGTIALVDPRLQTAPTPSPAIAWLWCFKARGHAALDERLAFEHAMDAARNALDRSPDELIRPGIFSFLPEKLTFYEAHGRVDVADPSGALTAAREALNAYDLTDTTEPALVRLEQASAMAQLGEHEEACRLAIRGLEDPHTYRATAVVVAARRFDRLLGPTSRAVGVWREFLSEVHPPDPTPFASLPFTGHRQRSG